VAEPGGFPVAVLIRDPEAGATIALRGELDALSAEDARAIFDEAARDRPSALVVDMSELSFMDSSGIALLIGAANQIERVTLRHPVPMVLRVIEITGLTDVFDIEL